MKQQIAILIGTLLILPGCAKNDSETYSSGTDQDTTATGAPASGETSSTNDATGTGSTFDTSGDQSTSTPGANPAPGATTPPPITPPSAQPSDSGLTNEINPRVPVENPQ